MSENLLPPLRTCPVCRWMTRETALRTCPQCGQALPDSPGVLNRWLRPIRALPFPVTMLLLGLLVLIYLLTHAVALALSGAGGEDGPHFNLALWILGSLVPSLVIQGGETWRIVAAMFLHGGILHVFFNGMALWNLGRMVENAFGGRLLWVMFFLTGVGGGLVSLGWRVLTNDPVGSVGASGSICGLLGLLLGALYQRRNLQTEIGKQLTQWIVMIAAFGLLVDDIDNAAHFGGAAAGFGLSFVVTGLDRRARKFQWPSRVWQTASLLAVALTLATFFLSWRQAGEKIDHLTGRTRTAVRENFERFERSAAFPEFERAVGRLQALRARKTRTPEEEAELRQLQERLLDARGQLLFPPESEWDKTTP